MCLVCNKYIALDAEVFYCKWGPIRIPLSGLSARSLIDNLSIKPLFHSLKILLSSDNFLRSIWKDAAFNIVNWKPLSLSRKTNNLERTRSPSGCSGSASRGCFHPVLILGPQGVRTTLWVDPTGPQILLGRNARAHVREVHGLRSLSSSNPLISIWMGLYLCYCKGALLYKHPTKK